MSLLIDTDLPSMATFRGQFMRPEQHLNDVIVLINDHHVWKSRAELKPGESFVAFFGGDYREVLEPDDPRVRLNQR